MYRVREVDGQDDEIADTLTDLHRLTFFDGAAIPEFDLGHWWLAFHEANPVAFAGVVSSTHAVNAGYFCRVGVLEKHWGNALQLRLMRALESRARHNGWRCIVSDTTDNLVSANNFIRPAIGFTSPKIHGPGRKPCIGASRSGETEVYAIHRIPARWPSGHRAFFRF
jgi:GNAT superfamily N-acetyltransferase